MTKHEDLRVRLYYGRDDDLIAWYNALDARGSRAQAVRDVLRQGLDREAPEAQLVTRIAELPTAGEIRQIVEAVLAGVTLATAEPQAQCDDEDDPFAHDFMAAMVLGGE